MQCLELWDIPFASPNWQELLAARFADVLAIETALLRLNAGESSIFSTLYLNGGNQTRSFLFGKVRLAPEEFEPLLARLADLGLVYILKNRSRLNNSADRVIMNEDILHTITEAHLLVSPAARLNPLHLILENGELSLSLPALIQAAGGAFPEEALTGRYSEEVSCEGLSRALLALPQGFAAVLLRRQEGLHGQHPGHAKKIHHRLDGQAMLALALKGIARQRLRACEGLLPGKRELAALAEVHGFSQAELRGCFEWLSKSGWIIERDNLLSLASNARAWLRGDMKYRFETLRACAQNDGLLHSNGRAQSLQACIGKDWKKPPGSVPEYREYLDSIQNRIALIAFYWSCGVLSLHCDEVSVNKVAPAGLEEHIAYNDGKAVMTGDMSVVIAEAEISPLTRLYLTAFTRIERDTGIIRARFAEKLFAAGLAAGFDGLLFLRHLEEICAQALPQSIVFTIQDWVHSRIGATVRKPYVLHLCEGRADEIMHDPAFLKLVDRRAGAHDIILGECDEKEIINILEKHGVCLDFDPDS
jgi:hypothetical protein